MTDIRFHLRDLRLVSDDVWGYDSEFWYSLIAYDNCDEVFMLTPRAWASIGTTDYTNDYTSPTDTGIFEKARLNTDSRVEGYSYAQGDVNDGEANSVRIRFDFSTPNKTYTKPDAARWVTESWSDPVADYTDWKAEVTDYLAQSIKADRDDGVALATYADWAVQFYTLPATFPIVIFYAGNDPEADEIVTEVV